MHGSMWISMRKQKLGTLRAKLPLMITLAGGLRGAISPSMVAGKRCARTRRNGGWE